MKIADGLSISMRTMQAVDFPHQGLLDVTNLDSHNLQLAFKNIVMLTAEMHHHHVPLLIPIVLPPVPFKLLKSLLSVIKTDGEVVHGFTTCVVEFVDPLDTALQVLDLLLDLDNGNIEGTVIDSLIFESRLHGQYLFLKLLDSLILVSEILTLQPVLVGNSSTTIELIKLWFSPSQLKPLLEVVSCWGLCFTHSMNGRARRVSYCTRISFMVSVFCCVQEVQASTANLFLLAFARA